MISLSFDIYLIPFVAENITVTKLTYVKVLCFESLDNGQSTIRLLTDIPFLFSELLYKKNLVSFTDFIFVY